jgi:hypothetical protein
MGQIKRLQLLIFAPLAVISTVALTMLVGACGNPVQPGGEIVDDGGMLEEDPVEEPDLIVVNFDAVSPGLAPAAFGGLGMAVEPQDGYLDANAWQITGFSDGDQLFGTEVTEGDFARGTSPGGVSTGGIYAFLVPDSGVALGVQATASDFAPGEIALRVPVARASLTTIRISYTLWVWNDQDRSTSITVRVSPDGENWVPLTTLDQSTPETADVSPEWSASTAEAIISANDVGIAPDGMVYLCWHAEDGSGSGGRDEFALDDISVVLE